MPIAVVSIPVADQSAAKAFYTETLLFDVMNDTPMGPDMRWIQLQPKTGGASIALVTWFEGLKPGGQQGLMLHVPISMPNMPGWPGSASRCRRSTSSPGAASPYSRTRTATAGSARR